MTPSEERAWQQVLDAIARLQDADVRYADAMEAMRREREDRLREVERHTQSELVAHVEAAEKRFAALEQSESASARFVTSWGAVTRVVVVGIGILVGGITVANYLSDHIGATPTTTVHRETDILTSPTVTLNTVTVTVEASGGR